MPLPLLFFHVNSWQGRLTRGHRPLDQHSWRRQLATAIGMNPDSKAYRCGDRLGGPPSVTLPVNAAIAMDPVGG